VSDPPVPSAAGLRIAVLASGAGTNLQAIIDQLHGREGIEVVGVASNVPDAQALERAERAGIETETFPRDRFGGREERDAVARYGDDDDELLREHARWALTQIDERGTA
jgi:phosphoribosylglycinamide formyltransferase-1